MYVFTIELIFDLIKCQGMSEWKEIDMEKEENLLMSVSVPIVFAEFIGCLKYLRGY